jgi:hypothetical protein
VTKRPAKKIRNEAVKPHAERQKTLTLSHIIFKIQALLVKSWDFGQRDDRYAATRLW